MHISEWLPRINTTEVGWIDLNLNMHSVPSFDHIKWLATVPELFDDYAEYENAVDSNAEWMNDELSNLTEDEHPAMHRFDGMDDAARDKIYLAAYERGYVRYGCFNPRVLGLPNNILYAIDATGMPEHLEKLTKYFNKLAKELPIVVVYHPVEKTKKFGGYFIAKYERIIGVENA